MIIGNITIKTPETDESKRPETTSQRQALGALYWDLSLLAASLPEGQATRALEPILERFRGILGIGCESNV